MVQAKATRLIKAFEEEGGLQVPPGNVARSPLPVGPGPCAFLQQVQPSAAVDITQDGQSLQHNESQ